MGPEERGRERMISFLHRIIFRGSFHAAMDLGDSRLCTYGYLSVNVNDHTSEIGFDC